MKGRLFKRGEHYNYSLPAVVFQKGHCLVHCDKNMVIDDGNLKRIVDLDYFYNSLKGVLTIERVL